MRIFAVILLLLVTGCVNMPRINPPPQVTADRSWVPADAVMYGMDIEHGFFRFNLNQLQPKGIGQTAGFLPEGLFISPDKSEVYADANGPEMAEPHYIYNTKTGALHDLGNLIPPYSFPSISPDWHYIASTNMRDSGVQIVDLRSSTAHRVKLPPSATETVVLEPAWSNGGDVLVTLRPRTAGTAGWTYWKVDPADGVVTQIDGQNLAGSISYTENGVNVGALCTLCGGTRPVNKIETQSGALAYISEDHDLVVKNADGSLTIVAKHVAPPPMPPGVACDCGPQGKHPVLWTVFDGDVLLYSFGQDLNGGQELWVYGIAEHKSSALGVAPIELVF